MRAHDSPAALPGCATRAGRTLEAAQCPPPRSRPEGEWRGQTATVGLQVLRACGGNRTDWDTIPDELEILCPIRRQARIEWPGRVNPSAARSACSSRTIIPWSVW